MVLGEESSTRGLYRLTTPTFSAALVHAYHWWTLQATDRTGQEYSTPRLFHDEERSFEAIATDDARPSRGGLFDLDPGNLECRTRYSGGEAGNTGPDFYAGQEPNVFGLGGDPLDGRNDPPLFSTFLNQGLGAFLTPVPSTAANGPCLCPTRAGAPSAVRSGGQDLSATTACLACGTGDLASAPLWPRRTVRWRQSRRQSRW
jgi:hypothetical protein